MCVYVSVSLCVGVYLCQYVCECVVCGKNPFVCTCVSVSGCDACLCECICVYCVLPYGTLCMCALTCVW